MIFNSHAFIFGFLPVTLVIYYILGRLASPRPALIWLTGASFFFYGWWNPSYLLLLLSSILFNFYVGLLLVRAARRGSVLRRLVLSLSRQEKLGVSCRVRVPVG